MRLKWRGAVDTLCRGEVAEWLNAAVSKTVTSVIPASGVRIPPSPRGTPLRGVPHAPASPPLVSTLRLRLRLSARSSLKAVACRHTSASPRFQPVVLGRNGKLGIGLPYSPALESG